MWPAPWLIGSTSAETQNDSASPSAAACAMAADANTIRRNTTCTPMNPSSPPASPAVQIASRKIAQVGPQLLPVGARDSLVHSTVPGAVSVRPAKRP